MIQAILFGAMSITTNERLARPEGGNSESAAWHRAQAEEHQAKAAGYQAIAKSHRGMAGLFPGHLERAAFFQESADFHSRKASEHILSAVISLSRDTAEADQPGDETRIKRAPRRGAKAYWGDYPGFYEDIIL